MKKTSILTSAVLAAALTAGFQARAVISTTTWTDGSASSPVVLGSPGPEIAGGWSTMLSYSSLVTGGTTPYAGQTLTGGNLWVEVQDDTAGDTIWAWLGTGTYASEGITGQKPPNNSGNAFWYDFSLNSTELTYLETHNSFEFQADADCHLDAYYLTVTNAVPDGTSTMMLLGGVLTTLGLIKRKMA